MAKYGRKSGQAYKTSYFTSADSGGYAYSGPLYTINSNSRLTSRRASVYRLIFGGVIVALSALCGFLPIHGMSNTAYVLLPYTGGLIVAVALLWIAARIAYWGDELREYVYRVTIMRLPILTVVCAIFAGLSTIGEAACLIFEKPDPEGLPLVWLFFAVQSVILTLSLVWRSLERTLIWEKR